MIRAGSIGIRAVYDEPYDENWEETADTEWDEKGNTNISHIYVSYNNCFITSIQFGYLDSSGGNEDLIMSTKFGNTEGQSFRAVILNEDEYVTGLSGVLGRTGEIKSLTFYTNCGEHGPIGSLNENYPSNQKIEIDPGIRDRREFGGFFGSCSKYCLSSIGIYVSPIARLNVKTSVQEKKPRKKPCSSLIRGLVNFVV